MPTHLLEEQENRKRKMKLSIPKTELQKGLARIQSIVEKRNTMPILANVLLEASTDSGQGVLSLAATDLEVGIRSIHPAEVEDSGVITVSAKKIYEIIRELPEEPVHITVSPNAYVEIQCARGNFSVAGSSADEYPSLPSFSTDQMPLVQAVVLGEMIEKTIYAACIDETRYNLNGVHLEYLADTGKLRMVATDGHRLAYVDRTLSSELSELATGIIIPRKGVAELKRLIDEDDAAEFAIAFEANSAVAQRGDVTLFMRLIEGEFPKYQQVVPREISHRVVINRDELIQVIRRVALLSAERSHAIQIDLTDGRLTLSSSNPDLGEAREDLDIDYAGEPLTIAFNARYLIDSLGAFHAKEVHLGFQDSLSPAQIIPTDDSDSLAVVMPMRV
jgi:DNA polymerase-3 subunit beta